jgi:hypothetical protein
MEGVRLRLRFGESFGVIWGMVNIRFTIYDVEACNISYLIGGESK